MSKRVLQINSGLNWGSTGKIVENIGQIAMRQGWESYVAWGRRSNPSENKSFRIGNSFTVLENLLETRLLDNEGLSSRWATRRLLKQIYDIQPDILHLHNIHGYYLNYPILFQSIREMNIPVVWTLHDCWPFTGHCAHFIWKGCDKWKTTGCHDCPMSHRYPASKLWDGSRRNFRLKKFWFNQTRRMIMVAVSHWLGDMARQSFLNHPVIDIYNGIDVQQFNVRSEEKNKETRRRYGLDNEFVAIAVATSWSTGKGLSDYVVLVDMINQMASGANGRNIQIMMVGMSDEQISQLPMGIKGINRTANIEKLADIYSMADVVLNLSHAETFGLTTVEGYACGTPCIGYNITATPELVSPETGYLVDLGDVAGVFECINILRAISTDQKLKMSDACRKKAVTEFDKDKQFLKYIDLYEKLLREYD